MVSQKTRPVKGPEKAAEPRLEWEKAGRSWIARVAGGALVVGRGVAPYLGADRTWRVREVFGQCFVDSTDYASFTAAAIAAEGAAGRWLTKALLAWEKAGDAPLLEAMQHFRALFTAPQKMRGRRRA